MKFWQILLLFFLAIFVVFILKTKNSPNLPEIPGNEILEPEITIQNVFISSTTDRYSTHCFEMTPCKIWDNVYGRNEITTSSTAKNTKVIFTISMTSNKDFDGKIILHLEHNPYDYAFSKDYEKTIHFERGLNLAEFTITEFPVTGLLNGKIDVLDLNGRLLDTTGLVQNPIDIY